MDAIADAFRMANGFLPVRLLPAPTKLLVPLVFVLLDSALAARPFAFSVVFVF